MRDNKYIQEIEKLSKVMDENELSSVHYSEGTFSINLTKNTMFGGAFSKHFAIPRTAQAGADTVATYTQDYGTAEAESAGSAVTGEAVTAPMVGVFYNAPSPEAEAFVRVGDAVKKGDVLCILEAMKLMNEIQAEQSGIITEICAKNGDVVEFGQTLFRISA